MITEARVPPIGTISKQRDALIAALTDRQAMVWNATLGTWQNSALTQSDISGLTSSLTAKANLVGGNSFTGTQNFGNADLTNGRLNMTALVNDEHRLFNSWPEQDTLRLANLSPYGYPALCIDDNNVHEKMALGYGNLLSTAPAGYAFFEISDASVGDVAPPFFLMHTTTYAPVGDPERTPYGQYHKILMDAKSNLYIYPKQVSFADPLVYSSFRHTANGQQTRFGPDSGHYFDFTSNGLSNIIEVAGGNNLDYMFAGKMMRTNSYGFMFGGGVSDAPLNPLVLEGTNPPFEIRSGGYLMLRPAGNDYDMRIQVNGSGPSSYMSFYSGGDLVNPRMVITATDGRVGIGQTTPTAMLHLKAGTALGNTAPFKLTSGPLNSTPVAGQMEYNGRFVVTESDAANRFLVQAASSAKTTTAAPYANDGFVTVTVNGTTVKLMTTA